jgi:amino acid permease
MSIANIIATIIASIIFSIGYSQLINAIVQNLENKGKDDALLKVLIISHAILFFILIAYILKNGK